MPADMSSNIQKIFTDSLSDEETRSALSDALNNVSRLSAKSADIIPMTDASFDTSHSPTYSIERFNPYYVESLLERNVGQLETCLILRSSYESLFYKATEIMEADLLVTRFAEIDEKANSRLASIDASYSLEFWTGNNSLSEQKHLKFDTDGNIESATPPNVQEIIDAHSEDTREALDDHREQMRKHREDPSSTLNLGKRGQRIVDRYTRLLIECQAIAAAIADGMAICYGKSVSPPKTTDSPDYLDDLVKWHEDLIAILERYLRSDAEQTIFVKLKKAKNGTTNVVSIWNSTETKDADRADALALNQQNIEFKLDSEHWFPEQEHVRLRGVHVFVESTKPVVGETWRVKLEPPNYSVSNGVSEVSLNLPVVRIGNATSDTSGEYALSGGAYFNTNPADRKWTLAIEADGSAGTKWTTVKDIVLVLRVAALAPR